jgi:hypothetical protein
MEEHKHHHHPDEGPHPKADPDRVPYWKRAHRDWRFWVAVCFLFAAIAVYVVTVDLALVPRIRPA